MNPSYPSYPTLQPNPVTGAPTKLPYAELEAIYNELSNLGFTVLAKRADGKRPTTMWQKASKDKFTSDYQLNLQRNGLNSGWCVLTGERSGRLVVVDIDPSGLDKKQTPAEVYSKLQELSHTDFVLSTPSGGVHMYYRLPEGLEYPTTTTNVVFKGVDVRSDGGLVVSLGGYNRYIEKDAIKRGLVNTHEGTYNKLPDGDYTDVPLMTDALYVELMKGNIKKKKKKEKVSKHADVISASSTYRNSDAGSERHDTHFKQDELQRETVVIECLGHIFKHFTDMDYSLWIQVWMSAHHGSPTDGVREYICENPDVDWSDGEDGRNTFRETWNNHMWREDGGFTVSSLFYLAKISGWLNSTGYEIPKKFVTEIDVQYITDYIDTLKELPTRLLLESQTGSGKTTALSVVWNRLGKPRSLILSPTVKLATELYENLNKAGVPATLYRDEDTKTHIGIGKMTDAKVLVSTLQTFATKVYDSGIDMARYGLVYIEEIDQLLTGFARAGGNLYGSHVKEKEARLGFKALRDLYKSAGYVWGVDATMTQVSYATAISLSGSVRVVRNTRIKTKATVKFLSSPALAHQVALQGLLAGKKVVAVCDTKSDARSFRDTMLATGGLDGKQHILIIGKGGEEAKSRDFMSDVNAGAEKYDLVCYNSVMGSGVSIDKVTPDIIIQLSRYLTPANNLQMLNRYRSQKFVYCAYTASENLYSANSEQVQAEANARIDKESQLVRVPIADRTEDALLRARIAYISVADEYHQKRSAKQYYQNLLKADGREIVELSLEASETIKVSIKEVRAQHKSRKDRAHKLWNTVRAITDEYPPDDDMTEDEISYGIRHGDIERALRGNIDVVKSFDPELVSNTVTQFAGKGFILTEFMTQDKAVSRAETYLMDADLSVASINNNVSIIKAVSLVSMIFNSMTETLEPEIFSARYPAFLDAIVDNKDLYDTVSLHHSQKFAKDYDPEEPYETAIKFLKRLLKLVGLKLELIRVRTDGMDRRKFAIGNIDSATDYLTWRNAGNPDFKLDYSFSTDTIDKAVSSRHNADEIFRALNDENKGKVLEIMNDKGINFAQAVHVLDERLKGAPIF